MAHTKKEADSTSLNRRASTEEGRKEGRTVLFPPFWNLKAAFSWLFGTEKARSGLLSVLWTPTAGAPGAGANLVLQVSVTA